MKPNLFQYIRAESVKDAVYYLAEFGEDARILAGGQSLVPTMALRMASPDIIIDISALDELQKLTLQDSVLRIGAGCKYVDILNSVLVTKAAPLLTQAIPFIAHEAIRNRGTIGGSLAHADPASELPACMLALNAVIVLETNEGTRRVCAEDFIQGTYVTSLAANEMITAIEIPEIHAEQVHQFHEIARRSGDYAISGGAFVLSIVDQTITEARLAFFAVGDRAILARTAAKALIGQKLDAEVIATAALTAANELDFLADLYNSAPVKKQITKTIASRLLTQISKERT